jgi:hypothetical protein
MSKYLYCEKCQDLVPESDTKMVSEILGTTFGKEDHRVHWYSKRDRYGSRQAIGAQVFTRQVFCGDVREPDPMEYWILYSCNPKRNPTVKKC